LRAVRLFSCSFLSSPIFLHFSLSLLRCCIASLAGGHGCSRGGGTGEACWLGAAPRSPAALPLEGETGGEGRTPASPLRSASGRSLPSPTKPPSFCPVPTRARAERQPHVHATGACPHLRGRIWGALARSSSPGGVRSWGWGWGGSRHPDQGWLHCSGRGGLFFSGWVSHCSSFSGHAFALPLFLRAVLASLFCCLPSGLVCYKPSMRCRPHALMHGSHIV
jgi:hypothetical protein